LTPRFTARGRNTGFVCAVCGAEVMPLARGSLRNHCPRCLCSLHVDVNPGDRAQECGGVMRPVGAELTGNKGWVILHRCERCGVERRNRAALDDPRQPDDLVAVTRVAGLPGPAPRRRTR
jgi:hypothetical protein